MIPKNLRIEITPLTLEQVAKTFDKNIRVYTCTNIDDDIVAKYVRDDSGKWTDITRQAQTKQRQERELVQAQLELRKMLKLRDKAKEELKNEQMV